MFRRSRGARRQWWGKRGRGRGGRGSRRTSINQTAEEMDMDMEEPSTSTATRSSQQQRPCEEGEEELNDEDEEEWEKVFANLNKEEDDDVQPPPQGRRPKPAAVWSGPFAGVHIELPYEPYKSQKQVISKVIEGLEKVENCLIESPTGTGKTAALLCSVLGWIRHCRNKGKTIASLFSAKVSKMEEDCTCGFIPDIGRVMGRPKIEPYMCTLSFTKKYKISVLLSTDQEALEDKVAADATRASEAMETEVASTSMAVSGTHGSQSPAKKSKMNYGSPSNENPVEEITYDKEDLCRWCIMKYFQKSEQPKIFYATRTHSQIQQVVDQLRETVYSDVKMTVFSGRDVTCINKDGGSIILPKLSGDEDSKSWNPRVNLRDLETSSLSQSLTDPFELERSVMKAKKKGAEGKEGVEEMCRVLRKNFYSNQRIKDLLERGDDYGGFGPNINMPRNTKIDMENIRLKPVCKYFEKKVPLRQKLSPLLDEGAWDIEDLKREGKSCCACPYYGGQALLEDAEIIFCPYNYLIDAGIRSSLALDLTGSIVIFDEAHNLESICRDAASVSFTLDLLDLKIRKAFEEPLEAFKLMRPTKKRRAAEFIAWQLLQNLSSWTLKTAPKPTYSRAGYSVPSPKIIQGQAIVDELEAAGLKRDRMPTFRGALNSLTNGEEEEEESDDEQVSVNNTLNGEQQDKKTPRKFRIAGFALKFVDDLLKIAAFIYDKDNVNHYRLVVTNSGELYDGRKRKKSTATQQPDNPETRYKIDFELMCLSPAIAFRPIRDNVLSVTVASGTLAPFESFVEELETPFNIRLAADHVIQPHQVFPCYLTSYINNPSKSFNFFKQNQENEELQDLLGLSILEISKAVPHGVLVFLPSYAFMNTLRSRWSNSPFINPLLKQLDNIKHIFWEEQKDKKLFEINMKDYKHLATHDGQKNGSILFAIFRGKVSEGINFKDDQARVVVTVGIPFPYKFAPSIKCKQEYNDARKKDVPNFLSGEKWYVIQAFRAINQAFGRCIRHSNDWGSIVLIESRFQQPDKQSELSKWVSRDMNMHGFNCIGSLTAALRNFGEARINNVVPTTTCSSNQNLFSNSEVHSDGSSVEFDDTDEDDSVLQPIARRSQLTQECQNLNITEQRKLWELSTQVIPDIPEDDLDSSAYSVDESDFGPTDAHASQSKEPGTVCQNFDICDMPTQII